MINDTLAGGGGESGINCVDPKGVSWATIETQSSSRILGFCFFRLRQKFLPRLKGNLNLGLTALIPKGDPRQA